MIKPSHAADRGSATADGQRTRGEVQILPRDDAPRTRGGWILVGTAAERRVKHAENGTAHGRRTRKLILDAAQRTFARRGYVNVGIEDIVTEAGVSRGTFYTYFESKISVFREVMDKVSTTSERIVSHRLKTESQLDPIAALRAANRRYIEMYRADADIIAVIEQVSLSGIDDIAYEARMRQQRDAVERVARQIRRWQSQSFADPSVDPSLTAAALLSMTSDFCFWFFADKNQTKDTEAAAAAISDIWVRAVGLRRKPNPRWVSHPVGATLATGLDRTESS
jgi:AcrR family transcriptional regulator